MIPAYIQIHDQIKSEIDQKIWKIGERLPSERDLAEQFQVSRMTLRQAITLLVEEGFLKDEWEVAPLSPARASGKKCVGQPVSPKS